MKLYYFFGIHAITPPRVSSISAKKFSGKGGLPVVANPLQNPILAVANFFLNSSIHGMSQLALGVVFGQYMHFISNYNNLLHFWIFHFLGGFMGHYLHRKAVAN